MLEFEENSEMRRTRGGRARALFAASAAVAAAAAVLAARSLVRHGGDALPDAPREIPLAAGDGIGALRSALEGLPVSSLSADLETTAIAANGGLGGTISAEKQPRTLFGVEFRPLRLTAWLVPATGAEKLAALARTSGLTTAIRPFSGDAAIVLPPQNLAFGESFVHTGIFIDYAKSDSSCVRFVPSEEWIDSQIGALERPSVGQLERLATAAPDSITLLRYFASIGNQKAASAVAARIRALSPPMAGRTAVFGGKVVWRGARLVQSTDGGIDGIRHYISIPSGAAGVLRSCRFSCAFATPGGGTLAEDIFSFDLDGATVTSFRSETDGIDFSVFRAIPETVAASGVRWALSLGVSERTGNGERHLRPEGEGVHIASGRVLVDGFE